MYHKLYVDVSTIEKPELQLTCLSRSRSVQLLRHAHMRAAVSERANAATKCVVDAAAAATGHQRRRARSVRMSIRII